VAEWSAVSRPEPNYSGITDGELIKRYQAEVAALADSVDHEERRRIWQDNLNPIRRELDRRLPPALDPRS
jgi:hypothetical protein